ncbi:MAG: glutathione S-transferase family protein [Pseudomonadota bacterium]
MTNSVQPSVITYTADISICSQICRLAVQEHHLQNAEDVHVDIEYAMDNYEPWFVRIQPSMTVPVMKYNNEYIGDSKDILYFLVDKYPEAGLYPEGARSEIDQFIDDFYNNFRWIGIFTFGNLQSQGETMKQFINIGKTEVTLRKLRALVDDPELGETISAKLEQVEQRDFAQLADPGLIAKTDQQITALLARLEQKLSDGRTFVAGSAYTLADVVATALLARVHFIKQEELFTPTLKAYWQRVKARPSFKTANICATWESTLMSKQYAEFLQSSDNAQ